MGHLGLSLVVFGDIPTGNPNGPPSTSFLRAERRHPCVVRLRSDRDARLRFASPRRGGGGRKKDNLQKEFYTGSFETPSHWPIARESLGGNVSLHDQPITVSAP